GLSQVNQFEELGVQTHGIRNESERGQAGKAAPKVRVRQYAFGRDLTVGDEVDIGIDAYTTEPAIAGGDVRQKQFLACFAAGQVAVADDPSAGSYRAEAATCAHGRQPVGILDFPDSSQVLRTVRTVHGAALHVHGGPEVVAGA